MKVGRIFFRVDGNNQIGLGHLVRCIALAQMLDRSFKICFVCKEIPENIVVELNTLGFSLLILEREKDFIDILKPEYIIVLDHYDLNADYQLMVKSKGCKLACIDDLHNKRFIADLIINHAPDVINTDYNAQSYTQFALGLDYAMLRPVFLNSAKKTKQKRSVINTVFVCLGGSDSKNITQNIVDILKQDLRFKKIVIVAGSSYAKIDNLRKSVEEDSRFDLYHSISAELICDLIENADLAIVPSSGILLEVLAVGCRVISGIYVDNQRLFFERYKYLGAFDSAECFSDSDIIKAINLAFENESYINKRYIDGKSDERFLKYFKQLVTEDKTFLRKAGRDDLEKTFEWAANKELRRFFFDNNAVIFEDHKRWFNGKMEDENCYYYLGLLGDSIFGSIRFDVVDGVAVISYLIDPEYQNQGLGTILLKKGLDLFINQTKGEISLVSAEVLSLNVPSIRVFEKLGYTIELDLPDNFIRFSKKIGS